MSSFLTFKRKSPAILLLRRKAANKSVAFGWKYSNTKMSVPDRSEGHSEDLDGGRGFSEITCTDTEPLLMVGGRVLRGPRLAPAP